MGIPARLLHRDDLFEDLRVVAGEESAAVDHHVDLIGAVCHGLLGVHEFHVHAGPPAGKGGGDRCDVDSISDASPRGCHQIPVHADRRYRGAGRICGIGVERLRAQGADFAVGIHAFERGQVHHRDGGVDGPDLRVLLDGASGKRGCAAFEADLINSRQTVKQAGECAVVHCLVAFSLSGLAIGHEGIATCFMQLSRSLAGRCVSNKRHLCTEKL